MGPQVVAIHQPNFLPWLGYFDKLARADRFVVLDTVQFSKTGGTWSNRVCILANGSPVWITMPVERSYHGLRSVAEMKIAGTAWRHKMLRTLRSAYARAPQFAAVFPLIEDILMCPLDTVSAFNLSGIRRLAGAIGLNPGKMVEASTLNVSGHATDLLIAIVKHVGGTAYLSGSGASGYQKDEKFAAAGLKLIYQNFQHPAYPQRGVADFVPGLSIVDALMNCGFDETRRFMGDCWTSPISAATRSINHERHRTRVADWCQTRTSKPSLP